MHAPHFLKALLTVGLHARSRRVAVREIWRISAKELVMLRRSILVLATATAVSRKTIVVLAIALVFGSSAVSTSTFARGAADGRFRGGSLGVRSDSFAGGFGGRTAAGGYASYGGRVSGLHGGFQESEPRDVWGHWGTYYGPMIH
jgi:uncharacterized membrane protein